MTTTREQRLLIGILVGVFVALIIGTLGWHVYGRVKQARLLRDHSKGYPVWLSLSKYHARFHHAVIFTNGYKYELRLPGGRQNHAVANVARTTVPTWPGKPAGKFKFFLVGWTHENRNTIHGVAEDIVKGWNYNEVFKNCQHFLARLQDRILAEKHSYGLKRAKRHLDKEFDEGMKNFTTSMTLSGFCVIGGDGGDGDNGNCCIFGDGGHGGNGGHGGHWGGGTDGGGGGGGAGG